LFGRFQQNCIDAYDAFTDLPTPIYFRELHAIYPDAKFIYTTRDKQAWLCSVAEHMKKSMPSSGKTVLRDLIRASVYGVVDYNESIFSHFYDQHEKRVLEYFAAFPDQFLVMDISRGDGWNKLCGFLGVVDIPNMLFHRARSPILPSGLGNVPRSQYDEKRRLMLGSNLWMFQKMRRGGGR
jgi:hypothetical protein